MKKYRVAEVFRPNTMPSYTYINRQEKRGTTYETKLKRALQKVGSLIAISGGSKTGKTVPVSYTHLTLPTICSV